MVQRKVHINLTIDKDIVDDIDDKRGLVTRSLFINNLLGKKRRKKWFQCCSANYVVLH